MRGMHVPTAGHKQAIALRQMPGPAPTQPHARATGRFDRGGVYTVVLAEPAPGEACSDAYSDEWVTWHITPGDRSSP